MIQYAGGAGAERKGRVRFGSPGARYVVNNAHSGGGTQSVALPRKEDMGWGALRLIDIAWRHGGIEMDVPASSHSRAPRLAASGSIAGVRAPKRPHVPRRASIRSKGRTNCVCLVGSEKAGGGDGRRESRVEAKMGGEWAVGRRKLEALWKEEEEEEELGFGTQTRAPFFLRFVHAPITLAPKPSPQLLLTFSSLLAFPLFPLSPSPALASHPGLGG